MTCPRCAAPVESDGRTWCKDCELLYDKWVRRHASDIVWQALSGGVVICLIGLGLPFFGAGTAIAAIGAFAAFGTIYGLARLTRRKRRQQFLVTTLPRAYLPGSE